MLAEAAGVSKIIIACGRTDLRKGIDGLAQLIGTKYDMNPFESKRQTLRLTLKYTPLVYERRGFLHSSGRLSDHGIK